MICFLLLFMFVDSLQMIKIFTFEDSTDASLSYAVLREEVNSFLPARFILCSSHMETSVDGRGFLTIYGKDSRPWLTLSVWPNKGHPVLWATTTTASKSIGWVKLMDIEEFWLNFWINICMDVDTESGNINVSVNGEANILRNVKDLGLQKPDSLAEKI